MEKKKVIAEIIKGNLVLKQSLCEALELTDVSAPRIAAAGAGGKTTTLKRLAAEYVKNGCKPVVTTTTHIFKEDSPLFLEDPSMEEIVHLLEEKGCVFAGSRAGNGKMKRLSDNILEAVLKLPNPVLIEADGAKMLPIKFPADHEPVILPEITHLLSVYGLDAVGRKIKEVCFRSELMADFLKKSTEDILTAEDIARLAQSDSAGRKGLEKGMRYTVILNKADTLDRCHTALKIWESMEHKKEIKVVVTAGNVSENGV